MRPALLLLILAAALLAPTGAAQPAAGRATLAPADGGGASGTVRFWAVPGGVRIVATVAGVPEGFHGLRIAADTSCAALGDAVMPFSPDGAPHGPFSARPRAAGSLGNIDAVGDGTGRYERVDPVLTLEGPASVVGRVAVVTARQDDHYTRPEGGAGGALLCGVIRAEEP